MPSVQDTAYPRLKNNPTEKPADSLYTHNCLIFYNIFEMSRILHELMQAGYTFSVAAIASLSPYLTEHINRLGRYRLDLERQPPEIQFDVPIVSAPQSSEKESNDSLQIPSL